MLHKESSPPKRVIIYPAVLQMTMVFQNIHISVDSISLTNLCLFIILLCTDYDFFQTICYLSFSFIKYFLVSIFNKKTLVFKIGST